MLIINDFHAGFDRKAGTTPTSRDALRKSLYAGLNKLLDETKQTHLLVLGDVFDSFTVETRDFLEVFCIFDHWLRLGNKITLVAGNHDNSAKGDRVSSFTALATVLSGQWQNKVSVLDVGQHGFVEDGVYAIAHCANQDLFDYALAEVAKVDMRFLLLHTNYDNGWAVESDHSLNVSEGQARVFTERGVTLVFAHEHQQRKALGGKVVVLGNQFPTSVSDCLGNDFKHAHVLTPDALSKVTTWARDEAGGSAGIDWRDLGEAPAEAGYGFVRVTGSASSMEASDVVNAIASYRQRSNAFVVSNSVKVEGIAQVDDLPEQFEVAKAFDVLTFVKSQIDDAEARVVDTLLAK